MFYMRVFKLSIYAIKKSNSTRLYGLCIRVSFNTNEWITNTTHEATPKIAMIDLLCFFYLITWHHRIYSHKLKTIQKHEEYLIWKHRESITAISQSKGPTKRNTNTHEENESKCIEQQIIGLSKWKRNVELERPANQKLKSSECVSFSACKFTCGNTICGCDLFFARGTRYAFQSINPVNRVKPKLYWDLVKEKERERER